jgi:hypothetical protein
MEKTENFLSENFSTYLYFYMGFVDAELVSELQEYLYEHVVNERNIEGEALTVGYEGDCSCAEVIRYEIPLTDATPKNVQVIKALVSENTNAWVASMGGKDSVY